MIERLPGSERHFVLVGCGALTPLTYYAGDIMVDGVLIRSIIAGVLTGVPLGLFVPLKSEGPGKTDKYLYRKFGLFISAILNFVLAITLVGGYIWIMLWLFKLLPLGNLLMPFKISFGLSAVAGTMLRELKIRQRLG